MEIKFGLDTFGDVQRDDKGNLVSAAQTLRNVIAEGVLADSLGLDYFSIGEHHRDDYSVSAPDTVLAGLATVTKKLILTKFSSKKNYSCLQRFLKKVQSLGRERCGPHFLTRISIQRQNVVRFHCA